MNFEIGLGIIVLTILAYLYFCVYKSSGSYDLGAIIYFPAVIVGIALGILTMLAGYWSLILSGIVLMGANVKIGDKPTEMTSLINTIIKRVGGILLFLGVLWGLASMIAPFK